MLDPYRSPLLRDPYLTLDGSQLIGRPANALQESQPRRIVVNGVEMPPILQVTQYGTRRPNELWLQECKRLICQPRRSEDQGSVSSGVKLVQGVFPVRTAPGPPEPFGPGAQLLPVQQSLQMCSKF